MIRPSLVAWRTASTTDTFFFASQGDDGKLLAHKATVTISLTNNVVEVGTGVQAEIFGGDGHHRKFLSLVITIQLGHFS